MAAVIVLPLYMTGRPGKRETLSAEGIRKRRGKDGRRAGR
ncbi:hypothetical protein B8V81_2180 [Paenibacillus pasadenensis]|uniref:Uncharacterized protein n=1 Tax=Paenibacillus pasadenensis TaxID=217090 RepID=A0A2N5N098_9BACL|nr:hypothetical protein B8V81_2180 [Paenibacillus pasadenensis]